YPNTITSAIEKLTGYAKVILDNQPIQKGDVLIIISVSGRNAVPIEMAQIARERGIRIIGITSYKYTQGVESRHPSGKKMYEFADVVIDNKVDKGDAILSAEGLNTKFTPASGITSIAIMHCLTTATIEKLLERGITPPVFIAANVDGGTEHNAELLKQYHDRIFYI
ncbi:MAG TPA: SIS domain-containing protein, partial [Anaerolineaceae bacterium]|nr:SIS domain-containing protein [Anaerolineaceae bacterium]